MLFDTKLGFDDDDKVGSRSLKLLAGSEGSELKNEN